MRGADRPATTGRRSPSRQIVKLLRDAAIVLGVLILMLAVLELALRLVSLGRQYAAQRPALPASVKEQVADPRYLWVLAPNSEHSHIQPGPDAKPDSLSDQPVGLPRP